MSELEDEAFEELAKRQGDWGLQGSRKHQIMRYVQDQERNDVVPNTISFHSMNTEWVMRITADRRIEVADGVDVTEAARLVLDAMQSLLNVGLEKAVLAEREACKALAKEYAEEYKEGGRLYPMLNRDITKTAATACDHIVYIIGKRGQA